METDSEEQKSIGHMERLRDVMEGYFVPRYDHLEQIAPYSIIYSCTTKLEYISKLLNDVKVELTGYDGPMSLSDLLPDVIGGKYYKNCSELYFPIMDELLDENYKEPDEFVDLVTHLIVIAYTYVAFVEIPLLIPKEVIYKIDTEAFKLLVSVGQIQGGLPAAFNKCYHKKSVVNANKEQKAQTVAKILDTYTKMGAKWCNDEPQKKPILLKEGDKISRYKLAEKIFLHIEGEFTQRHIDNYLKELHEKGEI